MTAATHIQEVKSIIQDFDPNRSNKYFLFGSSVREQKFHDIDLAVVGNASSQKKLGDLRDLFYDSSIPYKVDVVDLDAADKEFREHVLTNESIVWIP